MVGRVLKVIIVILAFMALIVLILPEAVPIFESQPMHFP